MPEKVLPRHVVSLFSETAGTNTRDLGDDALKSVSALSFLCDEAQELQEVATTLVSGENILSAYPDNSRR